MQYSTVKQKCSYLTTDLLWSVLTLKVYNKGWFNLIEQYYKKMSSNVCFEYFKIDIIV